MHVRDSIRRQLSVHVSLLQRYSTPPCFVSKNDHDPTALVLATVLVTRTTNTPYPGPGLTLPGHKKLVLKITVTVF